MVKVNANLNNVNVITQMFGVYTVGSVTAFRASEIDEKFNEWWQLGQVMITMRVVYMVLLVIIIIYYCFKDMFRNLCGCFKKKRQLKRKKDRIRELLQKQRQVYKVHAPSKGENCE